MKFLFSALFLSALINAYAPQWGTDFEKARTEATQNRKMILLNFSGSDWCGPCIKLKQEILDSQEFLTFASDKLSLVRADFPRKKANQLSKEQTLHNEGLAERFNPEGKFPFTVLVSPEGKVLKTWEGYPKSLSAQQLMSEITAFRK